MVSLDIHTLDISSSVGMISETSLSWFPGPHDNTKAEMKRNEILTLTVLKILFLCFILQLILTLDRC